MGNTFHFSFRGLESARITIDGFINVDLINERNAPMDMLFLWFRIDVAVHSFHDRVLPFNMLIFH